MTTDVEPPLEVPDLIPVRMVNEVVYCERLAYLEWVQGEWADNAFTHEGKIVHKRVDAGGRRRARKGGKPSDEGAEGEGAEADNDAEDPGPGDDPDRPETIRSVWLSSEALGLTGKLDLMEVHDDGHAVPVEYKRGRAPDLPEGAYLPERVQLCAQALLLRDAGFACDHGEVYFAADHRRVRVDIDDALIAATHAAISRLRELARAGTLPPPLVDSPKCNGCSLMGICLPDETTWLRAHAAPSAAPEDAAGGQGGSADDSAAASPEPTSAPELRRLHPARDDRLPLYAQAWGGRLSVKGERLLVRTADGTEIEARLPNTSQVCILGNIQVTTPALCALLSRDIPLCFFTHGGWYAGRTVAHDTRNVELRVAQFRRLDDPRLCLKLARDTVAAKVRNARTLLRRNLDEDASTVLFELKQLARKAEEASSIESLLGYEGAAARGYFGAFPGTLRESGDRFDFDGRNRRPPRDPVNALLSFGYALLTKDCALAVRAVGLEPLLGFYHQPRFGRPALALDLMEPFRPLIADSLVLTVINNGIVRQNDFVYTAGACALRGAARKRVILAYERRMDELLTHPVFGYRISYRRTLEVQARLIGRFLLGEIDRVPMIRTR